MKVFIKRNPARLWGCELAEGDTGEVDDELGRILVAGGIADCLDEPPKPGTVEKATADLEAYRLKAVPEQPVIAEAKPPAVKKTKGKE
jgi:hypothetical protein